MQKLLNQNLNLQNRREEVKIMAVTGYDGIFTGGLLTFMLVIFTILTIASIIWLILYVEMSQNKTWKMTLSISIITAIVTAMEIQLILIKSNIIF